MIPMFARIPDTNFRGDAPVPPPGTPPPPVFSNNWSTPLSDDGVQTWYGYVDDIKNPPTTPFFFTYNNTNLAADPVTGAPLDIYPGTRHPKGYRIGDLIGGVYADQPAAPSAVFYFNFMAVLRRAPNPSTSSKRQGPFYYWLDFLRFGLDFKVRPLSDVDLPTPTDQEIKVAFTHIVKSEVWFDYNFADRPARNEDDSEPALDSPEDPRDFGTEGPDDSDFRPQPYTAYRILLISYSDVSVSSATASTQVFPTIMSHSVFIPPYEYVTQQGPIFGYQVRTLNRCYIEAYIGISTPRFFDLIYEAQVKATVSSCKTRCKLEGCGSNGKENGHGRLQFALTECGKARDFRNPPPESLEALYQIDIMRERNDVFPAVSVGLDQNSPLYDFMYMGGRGNALGTNNAVRAWEKDQAAMWLTINNNDSCYGFQQALAGPSDGGPCQDVRLRLTIPFADRGCYNKRGKRNGRGGQQKGFLGLGGR
ncbi:Hypothetical protein POVN_LOCUS369 [uncultured virus]|nr:Hypothetical protein POVN_LOCUS369 [uncultured virus]